MKRLLYTLGMAVGMALTMASCQSLTDPNDVDYVVKPDTLVTKYIKRPAIVSYTGDEGKGQRTKTTRFFYDAQGKLIMSVFTYRSDDNPGRDYVDSVRYTWDGHVIANTDRVQHTVNYDGMIEETKLVNEGSSWSYGYMDNGGTRYLDHFVRRDATGSETDYVHYEWKDDYMSSLDGVNYGRNNHDIYTYSYSDGFQANNGWLPIWTKFMEEVAGDDDICIAYPEMFGLLTKKLPNEEDYKYEYKTEEYIDSIGETQTITTTVNRVTTYTYEFGVDGYVEGCYVEDTVTKTNDYNFCDLNGDGIITSDERNYRETSEYRYNDRYAITWESMPALVWQ